MHIRDLSGKPAFTLFILLTVLLSACGTNPPPAPSGIENIHVDTVRPTEKRFDTETFPLPNCGGTSELDQTLGTNASIQKSVTIGVKAGTEAGGEVSVPETARLQLKVAVEAAYQQTYESANSRLDTIGMKAAAGTHVTYEIGWYEQTFESVVDYSENNQVYHVPYTYKLRVPKIDNSYQTDCPGSGEDEPQPKPTNTQPPRPTAAPVVEEPALAPLFPLSDNGVAEGDGLRLTATILCLVNCGNPTFPDYDPLINIQYKLTNTSQQMIIIPQFGGDESYIALNTGQQLYVWTSIGWCDRENFIESQSIGPGESLKWEWGYKLKNNECGGIGDMLPLPDSAKSFTVVFPAVGERLSGANWSGTIPR